MTEHDFARKVLDRVDAHFGRTDATVFKHADRFTVGIPDISITTRGRTVWVELKAVTVHTCVYKRVMDDRAQLVTMYRLEKNGRSFYAVAKGPIVEIWKASDLVVQMNGGPAAQPRMVGDISVITDALEGELR
jgi:hypothetical protein